jgi:hypothetical protein
MDYGSYTSKRSCCGALTDVACIIVPEDIKVEQDTLNKADKEGVVILIPAKCVQYMLQGS